MYFYSAHVRPFSVSETPWSWTQMRWSHSNRWRSVHGLCFPHCSAIWKDGSPQHFSILKQYLCNESIVDTCKKARIWKKRHATTSLRYLWFHSRNRLWFTPSQLSWLSSRQTGLCRPAMRWGRKRQWGTCCDALECWSSAKMHRIIDLVDIPQENEPLSHLHRPLAGVLEDE